MKNVRKRREQRESEVLTQQGEKEGTGGRGTRPVHQSERVSDRMPEEDAKLQKLSWSDAPRLTRDTGHVSQLHICRFARFVKKKNLFVTLHLCKH